MSVCYITNCPKNSQERCDSIIKNDGERLGISAKLRGEIIMSITSKSCTTATIVRTLFNGRNIIRFSIIFELYFHHGCPKPRQFLLAHWQLVIYHRYYSFIIHLNEHNRLFVHNDREKSQQMFAII